ncbi:MAG: hypothetical protein M1834_003285 [Cirrosporium novae-zelandiae]|nr:MAG: hypothetical protein M1834_003285 [Cirrosporium novae-zelandiae]
MTENHSPKCLEDIKIVDGHAVPLNTETQSFADRDDQEMAYMGKKQQLKRNFRFLGILGLSSTIMITWEGMFSVFIYGLEDGGPGGLIYGFLFVWAGYMAVCASMAEMTSMYPTAGGQYHWTYILAPAPWNKFSSYITGWQSVIAWEACLASGTYLAGTMIQGLIVLNYPDYVFQRWHGTLLIYAVALFALFFNTYVEHHLPKIEGVILILHIGGFFAVLIPLVYLAPHSSADDVFAKFLTMGGYDMGLSWFVGLLTPIFAFVGADGAMHMCEEVKDASTVVPNSLMASIGLNGILGFAMLIAVLFCIGDINTALNTPTGYPYLEIFTQATNSIAGATAMASLIVALVIFACISILASASRIMWALARDQGLPGSHTLSKIEPTTKLPLWSLTTTTAITLLLGLINIGSATAFNAIVSVVVAGYLGSYILPISLFLYRRLHDPKSMRWGPWTLGRWGAAINIFSLMFTLIVMRQYYHGPIIEITLEEVVRDKRIGIG